MVGLTGGLVGNSLHPVYVDALGPTQDQIRDLVQETYACRFLDAMTGEHSTVIRAHDGRQLLES